MSEKNGHWPQHDTPYDALVAETATWDSRLELAEARYARLDGELSPEVGKLGISIVDGAEPPEAFSLLRTYKEHNLDPQTFGSLLLVNYKGDKPPENTMALLEVIKAQREQTNIPAAIAVIGYGKREFDQLKQDAWDMNVVHALRHRIKHPVTGLSLDADLTGASLEYFPNMFENEYIGRQPMVWSSAIEFDQPGGSELPLNGLLSYLNVGKSLFGAFTDVPALYAGSMATTLETYVTSGNGFMRPTDTNHNPYGIGEFTNLVTNIWQRQHGLTDDVQDPMPAYRQCVRLVGGLAQVSPRRELHAYAKELGNPNSMTKELNTEPDNPYRKLTPHDLAQLAATVKSVEDPLFISHLNRNDELWLNVMPADKADEVKAVLRAARQRLGLPKPAFDQDV